MTNTVNNVPRELLEDVMLAAQRMPVRGPSIRAKLHALLSAPSPAGVGGLELKRYWHNPKLGFCELDPKYFDDEPGYVAYGDAQAIIDGLRGEVAQLQSMLATVSKAGIRIRTERDQQSQRIGELEGLLREVHDTYRAAIHWEDLRGTMKCIDATLSAGKEGE